MVNKKKWSLAITSFILFGLLLIIGTHLSPMASAAEESDTFETYTDRTGLGLYGDIQDFFYKDRTYTYTYKNSNPKVVSLSDKYEGEYKSLAVGTSTISVYGTKNKKTIKVAELKVIVSEAKLDYKECQVSVGNIGTLGSTVIYQRYGATYTLKSSDPKVVTHTNYTYLKGVSPGTATVTVYENYKGKTRKLGTIKVVVISSKIEKDYMKIKLNKYEYSYHEIEITDRISRATYTYKVDDPKIIEMSKYGEDIFWGIGFGKTKIHVYETYNNKTRKVGSVTVEVARAALTSPEKVHELYLESKYYFSDLVEIDYSSPEAVYYCKSADSNIVSVKKLKGEPDDYIISPVSAGQTTLSVYEKYQGVERLVGSLSVTVSARDTTYQGIIFSEWAYTDLSTLYLDTDYSYTSDDSVYLANYVELVNDYSEYPEDIIFTSSNEAVLKITDFVYNGILPIAEGKADIIAVCGDYTIKLPVTVKKTKPKEAAEY